MKTKTAHLRRNRRKTPQTPPAPPDREKRMVSVGPVDISLAALLSMDVEHDEAVLTGLWFDWFCPDKQLARRARKLLPRVRELARSPLFDNRRYRVFFKNLSGPQCAGDDQINIVPLDETADLPRFAVSPPKRKGGAAAYWQTSWDGKDGPFFEMGTWEEVLDFFCVPPRPTEIDTTGERKPGKAVRTSWPGGDGPVGSSPKSLLDFLDALFHDDVALKTAEIKKAFAGIRSKHFAVGSRIPGPRRAEIARELGVEEKELVALYDSGAQPTPRGHRSRWLAVTQRGIGFECGSGPEGKGVPVERSPMHVPWLEIGWLRVVSDSRRNRRVLKGGPDASGASPCPSPRDWHVEVEATPLSERDLRTLREGILALAGKAAAKGCPD